MSDSHHIELKDISDRRKLSPFRIQGLYTDLASPTIRAKEYTSNRHDQRFRPFRPAQQLSIFPLFNTSSEMNNLIRLNKLRQNDLMKIEEDNPQPLELPKLYNDMRPVGRVFYPLQKKSKKVNSLSRSHMMRNLSQNIVELEYRQILKDEHYIQLELEGTHVECKKWLAIPKKKESAGLLDEKRKKLAMYDIRREKRRSVPKKPKIELFQYSLFISCILALNGIKEIKQNLKKFRFFVGQGNNSYLVKSVIRKRFWWTITNNRKQAHFFWSQLKNKDLVEKMQCSNPSGEIDTQYEEQQVQYPQKQENIEEETTIQKGRFSVDLQTVVKIDPRQIHTMKEPEDNRKLLAKLTRRPTIHQEISQAVGQLKKQDHVSLQYSYPRIHNHLECHWHLSNKKALFANMKRYYESIGKNPFCHIPKTFHIKNPSQLSELEEYYKSTKCIWIVKPGENTNRGNGISVAQQWSQIESLVNSGCVNNQTVIVQEYLLPFLYYGRKFDIRCYLLVTSLRGKIKAYWYDEGYIRTSSKQFTLNNLQNRMIHLTNDAVQKYSPDYGKFEPFNKISFREIQKYFKEQGRNFAIARQEMKQLAADCLKATYKLLDPKKREFCFEIFGLDFLIDSKMKTWLIEANTNPCLELSGSLLARIIPHMLENSLRIALDPIFTPPELSHWTASRRVEYMRVFNSNRYQLLFDEQVDTI